MKYSFIMLDYPALAALASVVREGSFERAAAHLGITPSAVSQRVKGLEERLGSILVVRGQPCTATDLGRRLCAHVDQVRLLEADLGPALALPSGAADAPVTLRIAVNADSVATWLAEAVADVARSGGILLDLIIEDEAFTADRLRSGEVLAAVSADPGAVQGCRTIELGSLAYRACCSPDFAARHFPQGASGEALARAPCMRFDRRDGLQARWARETHGVDLDAPTHWVPSTFAFLDFCLAGMAWGMHPEMLARPHLAQGRLVELTPGTPLETRLYWTVTRLHTGALKGLTDAVRQVARRRLRQPGAA